MHDRPWILPDPDIFTFDTGQDDTNLQPSFLPLGQLLDFFDPKALTQVYVWALQADPETSQDREVLAESSSSTFGQDGQERAVSKATTSSTTAASSSSSAGGLVQLQPLPSSPTGGKKSAAASTSSTSKPAVLTTQQRIESVQMQARFDRDPLFLAWRSTDSVGYESLRMEILKVEIICDA